MIESDQVATLIVKDMSRLGRNYIEASQLTETILPIHDARLIAVNDGVDSDKGKIILQLFEQKHYILICTALPKLLVEND